MSILNHKIENGSKIGNATVYSNDFLGKGVVWKGDKNQLKYITIHNTGGIDVPAKNYHSAQKQNNNGTGRDASWHMTIDSTSLYQHNPIDWRAWHCGSGNTPSFGIEVCMSSNADTQRKIYDNTAKLVAMLIKHYNISISNVVQHNHWTEKNCPEFLRAGKYGYNWTWFINLVKEYLNGSTSSSTSTSMNKPSDSKSGILTVVCSNLNVRKGNNTNYAIVKQLTKGAKCDVYGSKDGWYCIADAQWVSGDASYVDYVEDKFVVGEYQKDVIVTAEPSLSVRSGRGTEFSKIGSFATGKKINIWYIAKDSKGDLWGSCGYEGKTGYVHMGYTRKV